MSQALLSAWSPCLFSLPAMVTLVAPVREHRKVRDGVLETLLGTSWVTTETSRFGADTFLNIAWGKA